MLQGTKRLIIIFVAIGRNDLGSPGRNIFPAIPRMIAAPPGSALS